MMKLLIRVVTVLAIVLFAAIVGALVMRYVFGMRIVLDGGGGVHVGFPASSDEQARAIEAHREAQRAEAASSGHLENPATDASRQPASPTAGTPAALDSTNTAAASDPAGTDWTGFRGPRRDGIYRERPVITDWPADGLKPLWKQPVGGGYASFAIARGRAFTIEQRGAQEVAAAYDIRTGRELWTVKWNAFFQEYMGGDGPRATPTWADGIVYVLGATGEFRALDEATGKTLWRVDILEDTGSSNIQWGMAGSPLIVDDTVVVHPGPVVAYNRRTGARAWSAQPGRAAYVAPMLATLGGVRQIVAVSGTHLMGLAPNTGERLWDYPWETMQDINAAQPVVVGDNRIFISSGYGVGGAVVEITPKAPGSSQAGTVREVWRNVRLKNRFNSSVLHDGYIYGFDEAIFACVDAATGDLKWKGGRYGYGQVLLASGHLIVLTEEGDLVLVRATPDRHDERARFSAIAGKTWNVPAMSEGRLLIRNLAEMAAFDLNVR